jgi:hypothetical protein
MRTVDFINYSLQVGGGRQNLLAFAAHFKRDRVIAEADPRRGCGGVDSRDE